MQAFPQFLYFLRRSYLLRKGGMSLDERTYISHLVKHQTVENIVQIIQPALIEYHPEKSEGAPVTLD